ncbi:hypothetical protein D3C79_1002580 [compost metagenome]
MAYSWLPSSLMARPLAPVRLTLPTWVSVLPSKRTMATVPVVGSAMYRVLPSGDTTRLSPVLLVARPVKGRLVSCWGILPSASV